MPEKDRVKRAVFSFVVRKLFINIKRYARKPAAITPGVIGEYVSALFRAKVRKEEAAERRVRELARRAPGISWVLVALVIAALVLIPTIALLILGGVAPPPPPEVAVPPPPAPPPLIARLRAAGAVDAAGGTRWWGDIEWLTNASANVSARVLVVARGAPREIFVLRTYYEFAENYKDWFAAFRACATQRGFAVSEITPDDLAAAVRAGVRGVVVVPSGYAPSFLFDANSPVNVREMSKGGWVLIYIGHPPTRVLADGRALELSPDDLAREWGIALVPGPVVAERLSFEGLYRLEPARVERARIERERVGEPPTYFPRRAGEGIFGWGDGAVVVLPTTLDGWWRAVRARAADELCAYATEAWWGEHLTAGDYATTGSGRRIVFTARSPQIVESAHIRVLINSTAVVDGKAVTSGAFADAAVRRAAGRAEHAETVFASALTGELLSIKLFPHGPPKKSNIFAVPLAEDGRAMPPRQLTRAPIPLDVDVYTIPDFDATLPSGKYIMRFTDEEENVLAASYLEIQRLEVRPGTPDWLRGAFEFTLHVPGAEKPIERDLKGILVTMDGRYPNTTVATRGTILYTVPEALKPGNYTFTFTLGGDKIDVRLERELPRFPLTREHIIMIAIAAVMFAVGAVITRPEVVKYAIDVPDFPPVHAIAVPLAPETVCKIFEDMNRELKWTATPLTLEELRRGFGRLMWRGRPISIGYYNLERILDQLREAGAVEKALDYWGLKEWERTTGKTMRSLALQRALRDFFVTEGIPFIPFGQRADCDTVISIAGEKVILHVFEDDRVILRAIATAAEARSIIVFEDFQTLAAFVQRTHSAADANVTFKLLLEAEQINLAPLDKLFDVLHKRFTFFYY